MSKNNKIEELKAKVTIQRAEKAASEAKKSTQELQKLEKTLNSPQIREATAKVVKQAADSAVDNILREKKIDNEIKLKTAQNLEQQAVGARNVLKKKSSKKNTSFFSKRNMLFILLIIGIVAYLWKKNRFLKKVSSPKKFYPKVN